MNNSTFSTGRAGDGGINPSFKTMQLAQVVSVDKITVNQTDPNKKNKDLIYNSDPYIIRCKIVGGEYDNAYNIIDELPNCFPLIPKMLSPIPKVGETVLVFMYGPEDRYSDRFYIGPITSYLNLLDNQSLTAGSTANLSTGFYLPGKDLSQIESVKGVYPDYDTDNTFTIYGRDNTDIVFKSSEVLIRAGKFVEGDSLQFNQVNPAYIQIKSNFNSEGKKISVNNIVADKINLISHNGSPNYNLTQRDLINRTTPYITDEELDKILTTSHPLVFGDILLQYLKALRLAFDNHVHNKFGAAPPTDNITISNAVADFRKLAPILEENMLSKNVTTN